MEQAKNVRYTRGEIFDVVMDICKRSLQYGRWVCVTLISENKKQMYIPRGLAHGFITLTDDEEISVK